jgi:hypothetical protein
MSIFGSTQPKPASSPEDQNPRVVNRRAFAEKFLNEVLNPLIHEERLRTPDARMVHFEFRERKDEFGSRDDSESVQFELSAGRGGYFGPWKQRALGSEILGAVVVDIYDYAHKPPTDWKIDRHVIYDRKNVDRVIGDYLESVSDVGYRDTDIPKECLRRDFRKREIRQALGLQDGPGGTK